MEERVLLVDSENISVGTMGKMEAHQKGLLHRAFSIYLFNAKNELLLQKRAKIKYHSGGLWTNTCCGHPRPQEEITSAAKRRLMEEMGIESSLTELTQLTYKTTLENGLIEHEYLHVFVGSYNGALVPNPLEVEEWKWQNPEVILRDLETHPSAYTKWFNIVFPTLKPYELIY